MAVPVDPAAASRLDVPADVVRHEEQLHIDVARYPYKLVRFRKRIITEVRTMEVEVQTEVLDVDWVDVDSPTDASPTDAGAPHGVAGPDRLEFILSGQEAMIKLVTVPKERVIATRTVVAGAYEVNAQLRSERISVEEAPLSPAT